MGMIANSVVTSCPDSENWCQQKLEDVALVKSKYFNTYSFNNF